MLLCDLFRAAFQVLCQLRINFMNAPAAVTPMTMMAATVKSKYAAGISSSSASICLPLTSLRQCTQSWRPVNPHGTSQSPLATFSLNELRLDVKCDHDLRTRSARRFQLRDAGRRVRWPLVPDASEAPQETRGRTGSSPNPAWIADRRIPK
jgi:hypothetical protein